MPTRRDLLIGAAAFAAVPRVPFAHAEGAPAFVACCRRPDGDFAAAVLDEAGDVLFTAGLDARGHDCAVDAARGRAVVFARRPGRFAVVLDLAARRRTLAFAPPPDRLFAGHGAFSADGRLLFASEEDFDGERGVVGIYDATDRFRRLGEFASGGVGPHEATMLSDGRTLAIANGGILNHPDFPRLPLNIGTMTPSLVLLDTVTGDVLVDAALPAELHQLSIRHIAEAADGTLWFGGQYAGPRTDLVPLVGRLDRERGLSLIDADPEVWRGMAQYVGAIAASRDGSRIGVTSPRGGTLVAFDAATAAVVDIANLTDVGGLTAAPDGQNFAAASGEGEIAIAATRTHADVAFDNHIRRLG